MPGLVGSVQDVLGENGAVAGCVGQRLALAGDNVAVVLVVEGGGGVEGDHHAGCDLLVGRGAWDGTMYLSPGIMALSGLTKYWMRWWRLSGSRTVGGGRRGRSADRPVFAVPVDSLRKAAVRVRVFSVAGYSPGAPSPDPSSSPANTTPLRRWSCFQASNSSWALACPRASPAAISGFRIFSNMYMTIFSPT